MNVRSNPQRLDLADRVELAAFPDHPANLPLRPLMPGRPSRRPEGSQAGPMRTDAADGGRTEPVIENGERVSGIGWLLLLAGAIVAAAVAFALLPRNLANPFILGLLGLLAVVGVFALFAGAAGLLRFAGRSQGNPMAQAFLDGFGEGVLITDADGRIVYANRAYADLVGADSERDMRAVDRAFASDPVAAEMIYRIAQGLREGRASAEEVRMPAALDGASDPRRGGHWYRLRARPLEAKAGERPLAVWQLADVTAERQKQESAFLDLQHAIDYLDHAPVGFFSAEPDGRIVYMNATLAEWLGYDLARFAPGELQLADLVRGAGAALLPGVGGDRAEIVDLDLVKRNGQSLPVRLLHKVPHNADGAPGATRTIVLNRSPGEDASEALRAAEVRFTRFFNNTPIAIAAVDGSGRIGRTNAPFARLFGIAPSVRTDLVAVLRDSDRAPLQAALAAAARGDSEIQPVDAILAGPGERSVRFFVSAVEEGSADEAAIVYALETTEQRALEMQFAQSQKMQAVGQLAGGVAHDFNNVLTAIIGFSDLLLANHRPSDPSFQDIMNIKQNANRAASLVRQLLAFSRRQTLRPQVLALADVLSDVSILLQRLLGENVRLQLVHGRDLWPVKADLSQFEQVVINLAVNARDAMPGGGSLTMRTANVPAAAVRGYGHGSRLPEADYVLLEVEDTGTGIPLEYQEKIFEPFFSTKEVGKGTGLGLSTVYGIVQQTGGQIFFRSEAGKGTTFQIFIPRHAVAESEAADALEASPADSRSGSGDLTGTASILLVEDEEAVRAFAARALTSRGYKVHIAGSGLEALERMRELGGAVDLVVSDVVMPEMDGPSLLRELRKQQPGLKIIFVSGYAEDAFKKNLPEGESFNFLPKPFTLKQLATAVKETLEG